MFYLTEHQPVIQASALHAVAISDNPRILYLYLSFSLGVFNGVSKP